MGTVVKRCTNCKTTKEAADFYPRADSGRLHSVCIECTKLLANGYNAHSRAAAEAVLREAGLLGTMNLKGGLEHVVVADLVKREVLFDYEAIGIAYVRQCIYTPDILLPNGIFVEVKGYFTSADRSKHLLVRRQHPDKDIRLLFQNAHTRLRKTSKTTYAKWCDKHKIKWASGTKVPQEWIDEPAKTK